MEDKKHNFGLIIEDPKPEDYILGLGSPLENQEIFPTGHGWEKYLPEGEMQFRPGFETYSCVSQSANNCVEMYVKALFNLNWNNSDRFLAKVSGTTTGGNSQNAVAEALRKKGWVAEEVWPFGNLQSWNQFYSSIPTSVLNKALKQLVDWELKHEWVVATPENIKEALKYSPLQITGYAWANNDKGLYDDFGHSPNHAFMLYDYEEGLHWKIYDSYPTDYIYDTNSDKQEFIKHLAWDFKFGAYAKKFTLKPILTPNQSLIDKLKNMFKKIARDVHGGLWFIKGTQKQKIENWQAFAGAVIDEIGVMRNNLTDDQLKLFADYNFFGK